ncbi:MAG: ribonuclease P protein component [Pseudomonadota bacterium]
MTSARKFCRAHRVTSRQDYQRVFASARRESGRYWTLLWCANDENSARLGLAIAKRYAHRAVLRNRLKRLSRETFRHIRDALAPVDVIVMVKPATAHASPAELREALEQHWRRLVKRTAASDAATNRKREQP